MSTDDPLARKIATLVAQDHFEGKALHLGPAGTPEALTHILQAIDDTMLLRNAVFSVGQSAVTLRISGKRLLRVVAATEDLTPPDGLVDAPLTRDASDVLGALHTLLKTLTSKDGMLTLERQPAKPDAKQSGPGVGIKTLVGAWDSESSQPVQQTGPFETFVSQCAPLASSMIVMQKGEVIDVNGADEELTLLSEIYGNTWADYYQKHDAQFSTGDSSSFHAVDALGPEGDAIISAKIIEKQCFARVSAASLPLVAALWASSLD